MNFRFKLFSFIFLFGWPQAVLAGGSTVSGGGGAIVCFSIDAADAVANGALTELGRSHVLSAVATEYYLANLRQQKDPAQFEIFKKGSALEARVAILKTLALAPSFYAEVLTTAKAIGPVEQGSPAVNGLMDTQDSDLMLNLASTCARVQAVVRQYGKFKYDPFVWQALKTFGGESQQAILQLHEEIYEVGSAYQQFDSLPAQNLLVELMVTTPTSPELIAMLTKFHFGHQLDRSSCLHEFAKETSDLQRLIEMGAYLQSHWKLLRTDQDDRQNRRANEIVMKQWRGYEEFFEGLYVESVDHLTNAALGESGPAEPESVNAKIEDRAADFAYAGSRSSARRILTRVKTTDDVAQVLQDLKVLRSAMSEDVSCPSH